MDIAQIKVAAYYSTLAQFGLTKEAEGAKDIGRIRKFFAGENAADALKRLSALRGAQLGAGIGGLGGAVVGAATNEDDRLMGALKGGLGGAAVGGLAGGAHGYYGGHRAAGSKTMEGQLGNYAEMLRNDLLAGGGSMREAARTAHGLAGAMRG